jgi:hypothetical protein
MAHLAMLAATAKPELRRPVGIALAALFVAELFGTGTRSNAGPP